MDVKTPELSGESGDRTSDTDIGKVRGVQMRPAREGETPLVSIIMFVYNQLPYVEKAIKSVLSQEGDFSAEIIIHDDASTDGSREIIEKYTDRYPGLFVPILQKENQKQQGVNFVNLFVTPRIRGTYIAYCEGDDYWTDPRKLAIQIRILEKHPEFIAVCHNCVVVDEHDRPRKPVKKFYPFRRTSVYTIKELSYEGRMPGQTASVVVRNSIHDMPADEKEDFRQVRSVLGDRKRTLNMLLRGPVLCLARPMSAYRYVTDSGTSWNALTKGKNLAGRYFIQEYDYRNFAGKWFGINLHNDYVLFGTGLMACLRVWRDPSPEKVSQYEMVRDTVGGRAEVFRFLAARFPGALVTIPKRWLQEWKWGL